MSFQKMLIAIDESAFAAHAAEVGLDLARSLHAEVAFITVVDPSVATSSLDSGTPGDEWMAMAEQEASNLLAAFRDRAAAQPAALIFLEKGKPAVEILKAAANWPADVIVIGTHGRGAVSNMLMGSVAQGVLHHAKCPLLMVRAQS